MTEKRVSPWVPVVAVALLQTLALGWMVGERISLMASGREIVLDVTPVDPRSLFRGDYVILNYRAIAQLDGALLSEPAQDDEVLYVTLRQEAGGAWTPVAASRAKPSQPAAGDVVLKGRVAGIWKAGGNEPAKVRMRYGIESYFVPEGAGKDLEQKIREGELKVIIAVGLTGEAAIKGLEVAGKRIYDEPLL